MNILGILVKTRHDKTTNLTFDHAQQILDASRKRGHILIDVGVEAATRDNLWRILQGIGSPRGAFFKIVIFYCHGESTSPLDQNQQEFITDEVLHLFRGWGVYCIACDVGKNLSHKLLKAGAPFVIAFNAAVMLPFGYEKEVLDVMNSGILHMISDGSGPYTATKHMQQSFRRILKEVKNEQMINKFMISFAITWNLKALEYYGSDIADQLRKIEHGKPRATEYQTLVAEILETLFAPNLSDPHIEVSNQTGTSR